MADQLREIGRGVYVEAVREFLIIDIIVENDFYKSLARVTPEIRNLVWDLASYQETRTTPMLRYHNAAKMILEDDLNNIIATNEAYFGGGILSALEKRLVEKVSGKQIGERFTFCQTIYTTSDNKGV